MQVAKQVTKRERDMVIKNSELSFRVRTLEDGISELRKENSELVRSIRIYNRDLNAFTLLFLCVCTYQLCVLFLFCMWCAIINTYTFKYL